MVLDLMNRNETNCGKRGSWEKRDMRGKMRDGVDGEEELVYTEVWYA